MPSSLDATRLEAGLPERIAARMRLLLASVPDPDRARLYLERLRQESGVGFRSGGQLAGGVALRHQSLLL